MSFNEEAIKLVKEGGEYIKTKYFYDAFNTLDQEDGIIYACLDTYNKRFYPDLDNNLFAFTRVHSPSGSKKNG